MELTIEIETKLAEIAHKEMTMWKGGFASETSHTFKHGDIVKKGSKIGVVNGRSDGDRSDNLRNPNEVYVHWIDAKRGCQWNETKSIKLVKRP